MDYEEVMKFKLAVLKELYEVMGEEMLESKNTKNFLIIINIGCFHMPLFVFSGINMDFIF